MRIWSLIGSRRAMVIFVVVLLGGCGGTASPAATSGTPDDSPGLAEPTIAVPGPASTKYDSLDMCAGVPGGEVVGAAGGGSLLGTTALGFPPGCIYDFAEVNASVQSYVSIQITYSPDLQRSALEGTEDVAGLGESAWGHADSEGGYSLYVSRGDLFFQVAVPSGNPDPKGRAVAVADLVLGKL